AHAVLAAVPHLDGPFGVLNADDFYGATAYRLVANHMARQPADGDQAMAGYRLRQTLSPHGGVSRGICDVEDGFLTGIREVLEIRQTARGIVGRPAGSDDEVALTGDERIST
ncbi:MAG: nucleotidyltransferase, partial [Gemmatimonadetes bacterium]|nr:nucleotidyltransferase [Gemmatimonadota bacterium]NIU75271.1 nucleotidyltransferase [Gammaproteobacteria bacterium]NIQ54144.1 nucleotidyltransferase [Gemmatimonadota bacterium]NIW37122.1 nucleotidyltransferase [Gemmatimonadota bacterium]NIX45077.1 nucleotidyltransferase [Gemmatimonadota bacterium]